MLQSVHLGEVLQATNHVIGEIDRVERVLCDAQILNQFDLVTSEIEFSVVDRIQELGAVLDEFWCQSHDDILVWINKISDDTKFFDRVLKKKSSPNCMNTIFFSLEEKHKAKTRLSQHFVISYEIMLDLAIALVICGTVALGITPWNTNSQHLKQLGNRIHPLPHIELIKNERLLRSGGGGDGNGGGMPSPLSITDGRTATLTKNHKQNNTVALVGPQNQTPSGLSLVLYNRAAVPNGVNKTTRNTNYLFKLIGDSFFTKWLFQFVNTVVQVRRERREQQQFRMLTSGVDQPTLRALTSGNHETHGRVRRQGTQHLSLTQQ